MADPIIIVVGCAPSGVDILIWFSLPFTCSLPSLHTPTTCVNLKFMCVYFIQVESMLDK